MRRIALALIAVLSVTLAAAAPAAADKMRLTEYRLTQAEGSVRMTFRGDEAAGCRERGVCGVSGTSTYSFGGKPEIGDVHWVRDGTERGYMHGFFDTRGETVADVTTAGSPERCVDRVRHTFDTLNFEPGRKRVRFEWRPHGEPIGGHEDSELEGDGGEDDFRTRCAGPLMYDARNALPRASIPYRVFRSKRSKFHTTGTLPFAGGGFAGTVEWDLRYALRFKRARTVNSGGGFTIVHRR